LSLTGFGKIDDLCGDGLFEAIFRPLDDSGHCEGKTQDALYSGSNRASDRHGSLPLAYRREPPINHRWDIPVHQTF
jgi:hypothetical protein